MEQIKYYLESHVTIEPVFDDKLSQIKIIANKYGFKVASLLMKKRSEDTEIQSKYDTFMTSHSKNYDDILYRMKKLIINLQEENFLVWRYKIENIILDSRVDDCFSLIINKE